MRRTERLFAIAEILRGRRLGVTAGELARRFEVSERTIYRDLDSLRDAALPVHAERGRGGGFALDASYRLPPINFSAREAAVLVFAGELLAKLRLLPFTETLGVALDKVRAALPPLAQGDLASWSRTLTSTGVPARTAEREVRRHLEEAWFESRPVLIEYDGARGVTRRTVRIRSIVIERSECLLNCDDLDIGEPRQFRLHRIVRAEPPAG